MCACEKPKYSTGSSIALRICKDVWCVSDRNVHHSQGIMSIRFVYQLMKTLQTALSWSKMLYGHALVSDNNARLCISSWHCLQHMFCNQRKHETLFVLHRCASRVAWVFHLMKQQGHCWWATFSTNNQALWQHSLSYTITHGPISVSLRKSSCFPNERWLHALRCVELSFGKQPEAADCSGCKKQCPISLLQRFLSIL